MFELKVVGLDEAERLFYQQWPTRIISLTDQEFLYYGPHHLHVRVNDVPFVGNHAISPSLDHLVTVLNFTKNLTSSDRLMVHCFAGQSRSTAIAIAVMIQHGMTYREAFDHVETVRSILMPNQLFIQITDAYFGLGGDLVRYAMTHRSAALQRTLTMPSGPPSKTNVDNMKFIMEMLGKSNV